MLQTFSDIVPDEDKENPLIKNNSFAILLFGVDTVTNLSTSK